MCSSQKMFWKEPCKPVIISWMVVLLLLLLPNGNAWSTQLTHGDDGAPNEEEQAVLHPLARKLTQVASACTKTSSDKANIGVFYASRTSGRTKGGSSSLTRYCFTLTSNALRGPNGGKPCSSSSLCCDKKLFRTLTDFTLFTDKACDRKQLSWLVWRIGNSVLSHKDSMSDGSTRVKLGSAWRTSQTTTQLCVDIPSAMRCNTLEKLCGAKGCQYTLQTPFVKKSRTSISCCINGLMPYTCPLGYGAVDAGYSCMQCPRNTYADGSAKAPPLRPCTRCPPKTFILYQGAKSVRECRSVPPVSSGECTQPPPAITGVTWPSCGTTGTCSGSCASGYSGGPVTVLCNNGVWSNPTGHCVQECTQPPPAITGVTWPSCGTTGTCSGSCADGYSGGPVTVVCNNGVWSNPTGQCTPISGGITPGTVDDAAREAGRNAVIKLNAKPSLLAPLGAAITAPLQLVNVKQVSTQVVSGLNYFLVLQVTDATGTAFEISVTVWWQSWLQNSSPDNVWQVIKVAWADGFSPKCTQPPPAITGVTWPSCGTTGNCIGSCADGYSGGPVTVVCNNGVWSNPTGQCTANPPPVLPGGTTPGTVDDAAREAGRNAVIKLNAKPSLLAPLGNSITAPLQLVNVKQVSTQVVSGLKYYLVLQVTDATGTAFEISVTVWWQSWLQDTSPDDVWQVTSVAWANP